MRAVNLLPRETRSSRSVTAQNLPAVVGGGVGFLVVAALAGGYLSASSKVASAQQSYNDAKTRLAATPLPPAPQQAPVDTTPSIVTTEHGPRLQAVATVLGQRIAWDRVLREFSQVLPNDVWISSLTMATPSGGGTNGFSVSATTYSFDSVARMLSRMTLIPDLTGVTLQSTAHSGRLVQFSLSASIKGAAAPVVPAAAPVAAPTDTTATDTTSSDGSS